MDEKILEHFRNNDQKIYHLAVKHKGISLIPEKNHFSGLAESIICQQLSGKAGATIWSRFRNLFRESVTPEKVLSKTVSEIRKTGTSNNKAEYILNVAEAFRTKKVNPDTFSSLDDEQIIENLIQIKGVGRWTAEMFLIFSLGRKDVFPDGDLGLNKAMQNIYGRKGILTRNQRVKITEKWSPYRSYASLLLWRSLD